MLSTRRTWYKSVYAIAKRCLMMQWIPYKPPTKNFCLELTEFPNIWNTGLKRYRGAKYLCAVFHVISRMTLRQIYLTSFVKFGFFFYMNRKNQATHWEVENHPMVQTALLRAWDPHEQAQKQSQTVSVCPATEQLSQVSLYISV